MFINHQCRWLDDATYRMTASGMGKTFYCDLSWCVDPWKARLSTDLLPPSGHRDAGKTGIPEDCPTTTYMRETRMYEGSGCSKPNG
jgi:hypothetical protein